MSRLWRGSGSYRVLLGTLLYSHNAEEQASQVAGAT